MATTLCRFPLNSPSFLSKLSFSECPYRIQAYTPYLLLSIMTVCSNCAISGASIPARFGIGFIRYLKSSSVVRFAGIYIICSSLTFAMALIPLPPLLSKSIICLCLSLTPCFSFAEDMLPKSTHTNTWSCFLQRFRNRRKITDFYSLTLFFPGHLWYKRNAQAYI